MNFMERAVLICECKDTEENQGFTLSDYKMIISINHSYNKALQGDKILEGLFKNKSRFEINRIAIPATPFPYQTYWLLHKFYTGA
jgi:hypothetical protein